MKPRVLERGVDLRHQVAGDAILVVVALDEEAERGDVAPVGDGQLVDRVEVPERAEDRRELGVELELGERLEPVRQQPQALDRVDRVHRPLERQVDVEALEQDRRLIDELVAIADRERRDSRQELVQGDALGEGAGWLANRPRGAHV